LNKEVGNISYYDSQGQNQFTKPYSEETSRIIDKEVSKLIEEQYQRAVQMLKENKDKLTSLAEKLLEKEVIFKEDLVAIFGERPWDQLTPAEKIKEAGKEGSDKPESDQTSNDSSNNGADSSKEEKSTNFEDQTENKTSKDKSNVEEDKSVDSEDTTKKD
jgi:cell division protease FtsH